MLVSVLKSIQGNITHKLSMPKKFTKKQKDELKQMMVDMIIDSILPGLKENIPLMVGKDGEIRRYGTVNLTNPFGIEDGVGVTYTIAITKNVISQEELDEYIAENPDEFNE